MAARTQPIVGEKVTTPDGDGYVTEIIDFEDDASSKEDDRDWELGVRARLGKDYYKRYYRAMVELEGQSGKVDSYHCWEINFDADKDPEDAPWRS